MLIDSHCHLDFPAFAADRAAVIDAAHAAGVEQMVVPAVTVANFSQVLDLCTATPGLYPALGLHPCFSHAFDADLERLEQALSGFREQVVAVGEIGMDLRPAQAPVEMQSRLLEAQLQLAKAHDLPVLLHVVRAHDQVLKLLRRHDLPRAGIVHAFSGSEQQARIYAQLGFKLGFGGAMTHARAHKLHRLAASLPLEWLVLETDAPDMPLAGGPTPNQPAQLCRIAEWLAQLRHCSVAEIAAVTSATTRELLHLA